MHTYRNTALVFLALMFQQRQYTPPILLDMLPSPLTPHAQSLGDRVLKSGKERTTFSGELTTERGERYSLRVVLQLPDNVRIEGLKPNGVVAFDGDSSVTTPSLLEQQLIEIFSSDIAEAMITSTRDGAAVQLLGRHIRPDSAVASEVAEVDIYEWSGPIRSNPRKIDRLKRFAFDSSTGLLAYTEYLDEAFSPPLNVRIRFADWKTIDGSAYPGRIERRENGRLTFSWKASEIAPSRRESGK
jgi:hypothetical protein